MLTAIKLLHTLVWAFLALSILAVPVAGVVRQFRWVAILTGLVLLECGVLALNGGRCPLTDLATRFTTDRADNFDIYLPNWLAHYNKVIFGALFVAGELVVLGYWLREPHAAECNACAMRRAKNSTSDSKIKGAKVPRELCRRQERANANAKS